MSFPEYSTNSLLRKLKVTKTYRLFFVSVFISLLFTVTIVIPLSIFFHGRITIDYLISGVITAFLVSSIVVYMFIMLIRIWRDDEETLMSSKSRYKAIVENQAEFVCRYLPGGILTFANDTVCRYANMKREDLMGMSFFRFIHKDYLEELIRGIESLNVNNPFIVAEAWIVMPDGRKRWHRWNHHAIFNEAGDIVEYQATGSDITEIKNTQESLLRNEIHLTGIIEASADGLLAVDNTGRTIKANRSFAEIWGIPQSLLDSGDDAAMLNFVSDKLVNPESFLEKVKILYETVSIDTDMLFFKDGRIFLRYSAPLIMGDAVIGRVWSFHDITEQRRSEAEKEKLILDLREALDNVNKLSGLLPICASCKNIYDENGGWNTLETYISKHSEALFTHSICPECMKRLYPEQYEDIMNRKQRGTDAGV